MSTQTELHPSEIRVTCPPWCNKSREEHLEDIGNHEGHCIHFGKDQTGRGSDVGEVWAVSLSSMTYPDGTIAADGDVRVEVDAHSVNLTPSQARELASAIVQAAAEAAR